MGTLPRPIIILLVTLSGTVVAEQCNEPNIDNGVVVGTQTLDAYFGRVSCLPGFQVFSHNFLSFPWIQVLTLGVAVVMVVTRSIKLT